MTPEQMDHWEAHYRVKWEREAIIARHALSTFIQSKGEDVSADDLAWLGREWLRDED